MFLKGFRSVHERRCQLESHIAVGFALLAEQILIVRVTFHRAFLGSCNST